METFFKKIDRNTAFQLIESCLPVYVKLPLGYFPINPDYSLPNTSLYVLQVKEKTKPTVKTISRYVEIPKYKVIQYLVEDIHVFILNKFKKYTQVTSLEDLKNNLFYIEEQKTVINVNGVEIDGPLKKENINKDAVYYVASLTRDSNYFQISGSSNTLDFYLNKNVVFETTKAAQNYVKALLNHSS